MSQEVLKQVLFGAISENDLYNWLLDDKTIKDTYLINNERFCCSKSEFISYFLNFLRSQTQRFLNPVPGFETRDENTYLRNVQIEQHDENSFENCKSTSAVGYIKTDEQVEHSQNAISFDKPKSFAHNSLISSSPFTEQPLSPVPFPTHVKYDGSRSLMHSSTPTDSNKNNYSANKSTGKFQRSGERISLNFGDYIQTSSNRKKSHFINKSRNSDISTSDTSYSACTTEYSTNSKKNLSNVFNKTADSSISEQDFPALGFNSKSSINKSNQQTSKTSRNRRIKPTSLNFIDVDKDKNETQNKSFNKSNDDKSFYAEHNHTSGNSFHAERSILKNEREYIKKQFENSKHVKPVYIQPRNKKSHSRIMEPGDTSKITNIDHLNILVNIYTMLLDNNLLLNFINEISFVLTLLNVEDSDTSDKSGGQFENDIDFLSTIHNCIYFSTRILQNQKQFLILLDCDTLRILCDNQRLQIFNSYLHNYLSDILKQKKNCYSLTDSNEINKNNVCFQSDTDNRENFTSEQTFRAFRKQRDLFYDILRNWESSRHKTNFSFAIYDNTIMTLFNINGGLTLNKGQIRRHNDIVHNDKILAHANEGRTEFGRINTFYNNVCNMAHFARLFVKQLLASCENEHTEYNQLVLESLPNIDPNRLSRLSSRFVTNTAIMNDVTAFTGVQEFFKDFIVHCDNHTFLEHLKLVMCHEILEINGICLEYNSNDLVENKKIVKEIVASNGNTQDDANAEDKYQRGLELIKKVSSLRLLAKFLGFVTDLPHNNNGNKMKTLVINKFDKLEIQPLIDLKLILANCNDLFSSFVVLQWITMYLSMLNELTLAAEKYNSIIEILFEKYAKTLTPPTCTGVEDDSSIFFKYCLKTLLGYFFDLPNVSANFYDWRFSKSFSFSREENHEKNYIEYKNNECVSYNAENINLKFDYVPLRMRILEKMLYQNLPILTSLRSIIKGFDTFNKGRVRHVTPFTHQTNSQEKEEKRIQVQLEAHFFNNQPSSVRKTVEFVADRIFSVIVKEIVSKEIAQAKATSVQKIAGIKSSIKTEIETQLVSMCMEILKELLVKCNESAELICNERINTSLTCLFPIEMLESIRSMCTTICHRKVKLKYQTWVKENITDIKLLCKDVDAQVEQILATNTLKRPQRSISTEQKECIAIHNENYDTAPGPSMLLIDLQDLLCKISAEEIMEHEIIKELVFSLEQIAQCMQCWTALVKIFLKILASLTVDIAVALVCHYPNCLEQILPKLIDIWKMDSFEKHTRQVENKDFNEEVSDVKADDMTDRSGITNTSSVHNVDDNYIFLRLMSPRTILMLSESRYAKQSWNGLVHLLSTLLIENFLTLDCFGQQSFQLLRTEWSNTTLQHLSKCIKTTMAKLQEVKVVECSEITLLLEWMAEFCEDIDVL